MASRPMLRVENGNPLQYSCLENFMGRRGLAGYSPWATESDLTEGLSTDFPNWYLHLPNKGMNNFGYVIKKRLTSSLITSLCLLL